jgi:RNA polymerase sigma factor (sigma-70 family)
MSTRPLEPNLEELLQHASWLKNLARSLVKDPDLADELVQKTWVKALEHPPRHAGNPQNWLARVLRNGIYSRHRAEQRRLAREGRVSVAAGEEIAHEIVERGEMSRLLGEAVMRLNEPFRSTILMRFHEGMTPKEIAQLTGVAAATVRTRLKRGIEKLRADIQDGWGKEWQDCQLMLAGFAGTTGSTSTLSSAFMAAAALLVLTTTAVLLTEPWAKEALVESSSEAELTAVSSSDPLSPNMEALASDKISNDASSRIPTHSTTVSVAGQASSTVILRGRCVTEEGNQALPGCKIKLWGTMPKQWGSPPKPATVAGEKELEWDSPEAIYTDQKGRFEFRLEHPPLQGDYAIYITSPGRLARKAAWIARVNPLTSHDFEDIPLRAGTILKGRVLTEQGEPIEGATLHFGELVGQGLFQPQAKIQIEAATDETGAYQVESGLPPGFRDVEIYMQGATLLGPNHVNISDQVSVQVEDFKAKAMPFIEGYIRYPDGRPVARASLRAKVGPGFGWIAMDWSDSHGKFRIYAQGESAEAFSLNVKGFDSTNIQSFTTDARFHWGDRGISVIAHKPLHFDIKVVEADAGAAIETFAVECEIKPPKNTSLSGRGPRLGGVHADGILRVDGLTKGVNNLQVYLHDPKYRTPRMVEIEPYEGNPEPYEFRVEVMQPVEVLVHLADGTPAVGSEVIFYEVPPGRESKLPYPPVFSRSLTNELGIAEAYFQPLKVAVRIQVVGEHPTKLVDFPDLSTIDQRLIITVGGLAQVAGQLKFPAELAGKVRIYFEQNGLSSIFFGIPEEGLVEPDAEGKYTKQLEEGHYLAHFVVVNPYQKGGGIGARGWMRMEPPLADFQVEGLDPMELNLDARQFAPCQLAGTLLLDGVPQPEAKFRISFECSVEKPYYGQMLAGFRTDSEGKFLIDRLMPGTFRLVYRGPDGAGQWPWELWGEQVVEIQAGESRDHEFNFYYRKMRIRPLHPDTGDPMPHSSWDIPSTYPNQIADADGWLTLTPAPLGEFSIRYQNKQESFRAGPVKVDLSLTETVLEIQAERIRSP